MKHQFSIIMLVFIVSLFFSNCSSNKKDEATETTVKKEDTAVVAKINPDTSLNNFYGILASDSNSINCISDISKRNMFLYN